MFKKLLSTFILLQISLFAINDSFTQKMNYLSDYQSGIDISISKYKPMMVVIGTTTCPWCKKLENQTLKKKQIDKYIKLHFTPLKLNRDKDTYPKEILEAKVVPTVFFVDPKTGRPFHISRGYKSHKKFLKELEKAKNIYYNKGM